MQARRRRRADPRVDSLDALPARARGGRARGAANAWRSGRDIAVAVRSSATAEDLPEASFAGQQETFLNVRGEDDVLKAMHEVFASLFNDRAIAYRVHQGFDHNAVALSAGVQHMVRSDLGASGVMFTLDTDSGFRDVVFITASYGLGETVVQGAVNPDEFYVYKPALRAGKHAIVRRNLGGKAIKMVYGAARFRRARRPRSMCPRPIARASRSTDADIIALARQALHHRGALRQADGHRMGQGRRHRRDLHPAGAARDGAEPRGPHHPALRAQESLEGAGRRPQHRPAHRRGPGARHPGRHGDGARADRRRARRRHDRPGLGAGHEARRRPSSPIAAGARATRPSSRASWAFRRSSAAATPRRSIREGQDVTVSCAEGDTGYVYDGPARVRAQADRARLAAAHSRQDHDERRQSRTARSISRAFRTTAWALRASSSSSTA